MCLNLDKLGYWKFVLSPHKFWSSVLFAQIPCLEVIDIKDFIYFQNKNAAISGRR